MELTAGLVLGPYRLIEWVGDGWRAEVWRAEETASGRPLAIKLLPPEYAAEPGFGELFVAEALGLSRLEAPNLLSLVDFGEQDGWSYLVSPLVTGGDLRSRVGRPLTWSAALATISPLAEALDAAHARGCLHRGVRPSNVLLDEGGRPLLADFGLGCVLESEIPPARRDGLAEIVAYLAPEQLKGEHVGRGSDLYGLAVLLYVLLTGRTPFEGENPRALALAQIEEAPPSPAQFNPIISGGVEAVLLKALAKDPADRFPSGSALVAALVASEPVPAGPSAGSVDELPPFRPEPVRSRSGAGFWRPLWALVAVVLVGLAVFLVTSVLRSASQSSAVPPTAVRGVASPVAPGSSPQAAGSPPPLAGAAGVALPSPSPTATATSSPSATPTATSSPTATQTEAPSPSPAAIRPTLAAASRPLGPTPPMGEARAAFAAALLGDGGLFVAGGQTRGNQVLYAAERYDPLTNRWLTLPIMSQPRAFASATLLASGEVLVAGGGTGARLLTTAERFEPLSGRWVPAGSLAEARSGHAATLLADGRVLVSGGVGPDRRPLATAELYDPDSKRWSPAAGLAEARFGHSSTLVGEGQVLVVGGRSADGGVAGSERYDPRANLWVGAAAPGTPRWDHAATILSDDSLLISGGFSPDGRPLASAERYSVANDRWDPAGALGEARAQHTATLLADGRVLVTGGQDGPGQVRASAEWYDPTTNDWAPAGAMASGRVLHAAVRLSTGQVLVAGGRAADGQLLATTERFDPAAERWAGSPR